MDLLIIISQIMSQKRKSALNLNFLLKVKMGGNPIIQLKLHRRVRKDVFRLL